MPPARWPARWPARVALLMLALAACPGSRASGQAVTVSTAGDALVVRAPGFSFLEGAPLARLTDGRSVRVELVVTALAAPGKSPVATSRQVFALSYDLWEERFAVTTVGGRSQSVSHLTQTAAEAWCVEQVTIPLRELGAHGRDRPFWIRLETRLPDAGDTAERGDDGGFTLQALIDALSRRRRSESLPHTLDAGPFRLPPPRAAVRMPR